LLGFPECRTRLLFCNIQSVLAIVAELFAFFDGALQPAFSRVDALISRCAVSTSLVVAGITTFILTSVASRLRAEMMTQSFFSPRLSRASANARWASR
jgi:hypothetical protein